MGRARSDAGATMGRVVTDGEGSITVGAESAAVALDAAFIRRWIDEMARSIEEERDHLTQLDSAIGDADHGVNMSRGFTAVMAKLDATGGDLAPGQVLTTVGATLISTVGGASGPLYGTAFRGAGKALGEDGSFDAEDLLAALRAALEAVQKLGAAAEGDKTMVDSLAPAVAGFERELRAGHDLFAAIGRAREAAEEGMRGTIPMQARKGRASYLGPRSVGHQDPGATSTALVFRALERAAGTP
jgi:phosphoenolpyruvate---glycerone phosphotransferase subunit DhaL